jgi:trehalose/maltose hydrolase-like predicted phosphorylase
VLLYLLSPGELTRMLERLGYDFDPGRDIRRNVDYYIARTAHGSTLSRVVHSWVLARLDHPDSWALFIEALESDVSDVQGGTTAEGIHLGAIAGTVDIVQRAYAGLSLRRGVLCFDPALPKELEQVRFTLHFLGHLLDVSVGHRHIRVESRPSGSPPISVELCGDLHELPAGQVVEQRWAEGVPRSAPGVDVSASRAH